MGLYEVHIRNTGGKEKVVKCNAPDPRSAAETVIHSPEYSVGWKIFSVQILKHNS